MKIPLTLGAYEARSIIAEAQRCYNLFPESNPEDAPFPRTYYPTPGLVTKTQGGASEVRCMWRAQNGTQFAVIGNTVYRVDSSWALHTIGTVLSSSGIVSMSDNGLVAVIVDGSTHGYVIDLSDNEFDDIVSDAFYGANKVDYVDTYFLFNRPNTNQWYISLSESNFGLMTATAIESGTITAGGAGYSNGLHSDVPLMGGLGTGAAATITVAGGIVTAVTIADGGKDYQAGDILSASPADIGAGAGFIWTVGTLSTAFDPLDTAAKVGAADNISSLIVVHREVWLVGTNLSSEVWFNSGAADFTFEIIPGAFIEHGSAAIYSLAKYDLNVFWVEQDRVGNCMILKGNGYSVVRVSTHAIEKSISSYGDVSDAIGFTYMQEGHSYYVVTFPSAESNTGRTWVYDIGENEWHERGSNDENGVQYRHRANCSAFFNGIVVVGDFENGRIYQWDLDLYTDDETPITRIRSFPHLTNEEERVTTRSLTANYQVGEPLQTDTDTYFVSLRWSDTRGASWSNSVTQSIGNTGEYYTSPQWSRLGMARDRVYELSWSAPMKTALSGAYIDIVAAAS